MLDEATRTAILKLKSEGHSARMIAKAVGVSRFGVAAVIKQGEAAVPAASRDSQVQAFREQILELYSRYEGHLVRVHEVLAKEGAAFSYSTLTAFCRKHEIGKARPKPAGRYTFQPGEEMQHDTSPHQAKIAGVIRPVQTASLVLCHSRMIYFQHYPRFTRFECKAFLTAAVSYFGGSAESCMIDLC